MEKHLIPNKKSIVEFKEQDEFLLRCEVKDIIPVKRSILSELVFILLSLLSLGLLALILIWNKKLWKTFRFKRTKIEEATYIIIINEHDEEILTPKEHQQDENNSRKIVITYRYMKYIYDNDEFIMLRNCLNMTQTDIHSELGKGIHEENYALMRSIFGINTTKIRVDSVIKIFTEEAITSFNLYQLFAVVVWYFRDYALYAGIILIFVIFSIIFQIVLIRGEQKKINSMADYTKVEVFRQKKSESGPDVQHTRTVDSSQLVPGDIIYVNADQKVPCDLIVLDGQALVDESLLTGESVPMLKLQLPNNDDLFKETNKENLIYAGTYCLTSVGSKDKNKPCLAMVYQIGFGTTKGRLIRSIMFNNPASYRFERDSNYFTLYIFCVALTFVMIYYYIAFTHFSKSERNLGDIFLPSLDIILTMVPPGLSLCLSIGIEYAQNRLKNKQIVALKGRLINASGRMKAIYFDKTGTLTINEMKLHNVVMNQQLSHTSATNFALLDLEHAKNKNAAVNDHRDEFMGLMKNFATNQSLTNVKGRVLGDPMEDELFKYAGAHMVDEADSAPDGLGGLKYFKRVRMDELFHDGKVRQSILEVRRSHADHVKEQIEARKSQIEAKRSYLEIQNKKSLAEAKSSYYETFKFDKDEEGLLSKGKADLNTLYVLAILDFKPQLQRMSVIARDSQTNSNFVFTKGAPEKVIKLCKPQTLPADLDAVVKRLAKNGYRILAFACKQIPTSDSLVNSRDSYESELTFQGLAIFKNNLKDMTKPTIENLKANDFRVGMITGDNINTAVSIAKNCRLVDPKRETVGIFTFEADELVFTPVDGMDEGDSFELEEIHGEVEPSKSVKAARPKIGAIDSDNFAKIVQRYQLEEATTIDLENPTIRELALKCAVFARMNPEQKALIIRIMKTYFKKFEVTVGFCGDGANDCIALKEADIGISLSKTEASLSAPFISNIEDISCTEIISAEGKAALTTNFDCFRFFCLYSIIQTIGLIVLYAELTEYSVAVYITCDIFMALNIANCMGLLKPVPELRKELPKCTLFYKEMILSVFLNCALAFVYIFNGLWIVRQDPNYKSPSDIVGPDSDGAPDGHVATYETTVSSRV